MTISIVFLCAVAGAFYVAYRESWEYIGRGLDIPYRRVWIKATLAVFIVTACAVVAQLAVLFLRGT